MPPQSKNQPPACSDLREALQELKEKQAEFRSALDQGRTTGDLKPAQALKAKIEQKMASLKERLWPFKELSQPELEKQYQAQKEIFQKTGILERFSNGELGIKGIDDQEYPFPELPDIFKMMRENKEILKIKSEQGFKNLLITPFGMKLGDLAYKYGQAILKHHQAGKLFATKKNQDDPSEPLKPLELDEGQPLWMWDGYADADRSGELVYRPKQLPTQSEAPDRDQRRQKSQGKTKKELLEQEKTGPEGQAYGAGWDIQLIEDLPNIPRKDQGQTVGGRPQLDTAGTSLEKYIQKGETVSSPQEYLKAIQNEPIYAHEQGMTPEDQLAYAILHLEQTDQVIDDWRGNGSLSYQLGSYFLSGRVPIAVWRRGYRQAYLYGYDPGNRNDDYGVRSGVRVSKF